MTYGIINFNEYFMRVCKYCVYLLARRFYKNLYIKHVNYMLKPFISLPIFCLFDLSISWKKTFTMSHCECEFADFSLYSEPFISVSFLDINQPYIEKKKKSRKYQKEKIENA